MPALVRLACGVLGPGELSPRRLPASAAASDAASDAAPTHNMVLQKLVPQRWHKARAKKRGHGSEANGLEVVCASPRASDAAMSSVMVAHSDSEFNNNHGLILDNNQISPEELALLAKLEEANRLIEADAKSLNSISNNSGHSRKSSDTSQISLTSGTSSSQDRNCADDGEEDAWSIWGRVANDWETTYKKKTAFVKEMVRKGVPHPFRGIVWPLLCSAHDSPVKKQYADYIKATSACEKVIRRDIARTYPEHDFFKEKDGTGQESLFNVMKAYSLHDREVGYCQGSGFIVGLLLMQMPEEEAFAVFVRLMQEYRMRDMFKPTMAELGLCMYQLENLVQELIPDLHVHFQSQSFHTSMYASSWFLTLFTTALALPTACRVIDVFLLEGMEIIFKVAIALLTMGKEDLLCLDMEGMLKFFQKDLPPKADADPDGLMNLAYNVKFNPKKMKKLEKEYTVMKIKEQEEMVELRRLRSDNRLLKQRVELLEAESSALAGRLVQGQVSRADKEEESFVYQRELAALRHTHLETTHQLELAHEEITKLSLKLQQNDNSCQSSLEEVTAKQEQLSQKEELVSCLQSQLVKERLRQAENDALIRDLRARIQELEEVSSSQEQQSLTEDLVSSCLQAQLVKERLRQAENDVLIRDLRAQIQELEQDKKTLRESTVDNSVAHLQEELIAVKLREAEANLSLKELRQRVSELGAQWQRHLQEHRVESPPAPDSTPKKIVSNLFGENRSHETQRLEEELMTTRVKEIEAITELKELRLKVMELETQVQVSGNQLRRQDQDIKQLREELDLSAVREKELTSKLREQQHRYTDLESKMKDDLMMARIRDAEHAQSVAELNQKISRLELKNSEMVAEGELRSNLDDSDKVRELQDKMAEMKSEIVRLESWKTKWIEGGGAPPAPPRSGSVDTESEHDDDLQLHPPT